MDVLIWIIVSTFLMSMIAWVGLVLLFIKDDLLQKILAPLIGLSAGSLFAGALFHMIPEAYIKMGVTEIVPLWVVAGFTIFLLLELFLNWHHCHHVHTSEKTAVTYLILVADGLHNFLGGLAIAGSFLISPEIGIITWLAAAGHEIPQEFGDFGILVHGGWSKMKALVFNYLSAFTIVIGGLLAYFLSESIDTTFLLPFAAGNFIYIAAADLIPELSHTHDTRRSLSKSMINFIAILAGIFLIVFIRLLVKG